MNRSAYLCAALTLLCMGSVVQVSHGASKVNAQFSVVARQRLDSVKVKASDFTSHNMTRTVAATEGTHLELIRIKADAEWAQGESSTLYTSLELIYPGEKEAVECVGCAYRNLFGVFESDNSFQMLVRKPDEKGVQRATSTKDFVFYVPDNPKSLMLKVIESGSDREHKLPIPEKFSAAADPESIKVNISVVGSEYASSIGTEDSVSYSPSVKATEEWTTTSGQFMIVKAQVVLDKSISPEIKNITLTPEQFSLKLPDGSTIQAIGSLGSYKPELNDADYTHSYGRNNDGTWPEGGAPVKFVFIVPKKLPSFDLIFSPR